MELNTILMFISYGIVIALIGFTAYVFLNVYKPKPKDPNKKTKKEKKAVKPTETKVVKKGKKEMAINTDGDIITLGGQVSEVESSSKIRIPNED